MTVCQLLGMRNNGALMTVRTHSFVLRYLAASGEVGLKPLRRYVATAGGTLRPVASRGELIAEIGAESVAGGDVAETRALLFVECDTCTPDSVLEAGVKGHALCGIRLAGESGGWPLAANDALWKVPSFMVATNLDVAFSAAGVAAIRTLCEPRRATTADLFHWGAWNQLASGDDPRSVVAQAIRAIKWDGESSSVFVKAVDALSARLGCGSIGTEVWADGILMGCRVKCGGKCVDERRLRELSEALWQTGVSNALIAATRDGGVEIVVAQSMAPSTARVAFLSRRDEKGG